MSEIGTLNELSVKEGDKVILLGDRRGNYADTLCRIDEGGAAVSIDNGEYPAKRFSPAWDEEFGRKYSKVLVSTPPHKGTLSEMRVKPGDVVEFRDGKTSGVYTVETAQHLRSHLTGAMVAYNNWDSCPKFHILARAEELVPWKDMPRDKKGEYLLAQSEGKDVEYWGGSEWRKAHGKPKDNLAYRVNMIPAVETVELSAPLHLSNGRTLPRSKYKITVDMEGDIPLVDTIKMERV